MEVTMPTHEVLEAIKATGTSGRLFYREVGPYRLSIIYRECSALGAYGSWYPEAMVFRNGRIEYRGEGWSDFRRFHNLDTEEKVINFITPEDED